MPIIDIILAFANHRRNLTLANVLVNVDLGIYTRNETDSSGVTAEPLYRLLLTATLGKYQPLKVMMKTSGTANVLYANILYANVL